MERRYWLVYANGARQLIDPRRFTLQELEVRARALGGRVVIEAHGFEAQYAPGAASTHDFDPPISAIGPLFRSRFERIHKCRVPFQLEISPRKTTRVLGGYYKKTRLVRVYAHDRATDRRPLEELFDTFLHEVAHHLEYTEPDAFDAAFCGRVPGRMHSALFWRILSYLKRRWHEVQHGGKG